MGAAEYTIVFYLPGLTLQLDTPFDKGNLLCALRTAWPEHHLRHILPDEEWIENLSNHLGQLTQERIDMVQKWIDINTSRFAENTASMDPLKREFNKMAGDLKASVQLCKMKCASCHLLCVDYRHHDGGHNCSTDHLCPNACHYEHVSSDSSQCGLS